jgi:predicted DNA-binding helix-hairpin-helix protein
MDVPSPGLAPPSPGCKPKSTPKSKIIDHMKKIKKKLESKAEDNTQKKRIRKAVLAGNHNELATVFEEYLTKLETVNTLMKQIEESIT